MSVFVKLVAERKIFRNYRHIIVQQRFDFTLGTELIGGSWFNDLTARINTHKVIGKEKSTLKMHNADYGSAEFGGHLR